MTAGPRETRELSPLEMARNLAGAVYRYARQSESDQIGSLINQAGERAHAAAQLAGAMALVSIAESLATIANDFGYLVDDGGAPYRQVEDVHLPGDGEGAIDDARATREHMRHWAEGSDTHPGEEEPP